MARLTPVNYNMQVLNPLQTAMAGYQAGFGQFQQLDDVRRQREADRMAAEKHGLQMELLRAQTAQQVRETERANAMQSALGTMWGRMADGENVTSRDVENMMMQFPELKDTLDTTYERLSTQEREAQFNSIFRIGMLGSDPDLFTAEMQRNIDARADNPDEQKVWEGMLQAYNAAEAQEPGGGAAAARLYAGMSLLSLADNEEQRNLVESKFFPQQEKPPEGFRTLQARAQAAGLQPGTPEYQEFMRRGGAERGPLVQVSTAPESTGYAVEEYARVAGRGIATVHGNLSEAGYAAGRRTAQIDQLQELLDAVGDDTGTLAGFKQAVLQATGIEIQGADKIQAAEALISQLVPQQRPPGSGPMSDADLELFKRSLPKIMGTAEGNRQIIQTMKEIAAYDMEVGRIARSAMYGEISPQEADRQIAEVYNPLAKLRSIEDLAADL